MAGGTRVVAAPGVRSGTGRGTRAAIGAAATTVMADPALWLLGALSFSVRGGVLLILLPILWVPSPVLLSVFFGQYITTSGLSPDVVPVALSGGLAAGVALIAAVALAAYAQLTSFERIAAGRETAALRMDRVPRSLHGRERAGVVLRLTVLNVVGLVPMLLLLPVVGARIGDAALAELQLPTSTDTPFAITVLGRVQNELLALAFVVVVMDLLTALAAHQLLATRLGVPPSPARAGVQHRDLRALASGTSRVVRQPIRTVLLTMLAWLVTIGALAVAVGGTVLGWETLRAILFMATPSSPVDAEVELIGRLVALAVFGAIWVAGITLAGFASSLRGALWSTNALH